MLRFATGVALSLRAFAIARPVLGPVDVADEILASQVGALQQQVRALQGMSGAQVDMHLADSVGRLRRHRVRQIRLLIADRHIGPAQVALARRASRWGCDVLMDLGRGQQHGDSCGYNSAFDVGQFLAHCGEGPRWQPQATTWQPRQASLGGIAAANDFLDAGGGLSARLLSSMEVSRLVSHAADQQGAREVDGFGGGLAWDQSLAALHDAMLQST